MKTAPDILQKASRAVSRARAELVMAQPFFGTLALRLKVAPNEDMDTIGVDGVTITYNPAFVLSLPPAELTGVVAHEVMHCALAHHVRRGARDPEQWNAACDYAINPIIQKAGLHLPDSALIDPAYDGMSAEAIYSKLPQKPKSPKGQQGGAGQGQGQGQGQPQPQPSASNGQGQGQDTGGTGSVQDHPNAKGKADQATEETNWQVATSQAAAVAKAAGKLPGNIAELVAEQNAPKHDWKEQLRDFISARAPEDFSWRRPNRRFVGTGVYLPSLDGHRIGAIGLVIDTSASVSAKELEAFRAELQGIFEDARPEAIRVIQCDTRIAEDRVFDPVNEELEFTAKGRGGTDMVPAFDAMMEGGEVEVEALICMSDMEMDFPKDPGVPVLWVSTSGPDSRYVPSYGQVIHLEVEGGR
jgi:predicted metal-dependent peptidase